MTAKRVLVTGASGYVGRHSLQPLADRGYEVHAVHSSGSPAGPATWHRADLMDPAARDALLDAVRPTHLLHFAWYAAHGLYWTSVENLRWVEASLALLRGFAERGGTRATIAGTCAEYDWRYGFCSENVTPTVPATLYGASKVGLHAVAAAFAKQAGLSLAWGRIFFPYGLGESPNRLVPAVVRAALAGGPVKCTHGRQARDFLFATDCGSAFAAILDSAVAGPVNVGSGRAVPLRDVVAGLVNAVPGSDNIRIEYGAVPVPADDPPLLVADVRRLTQEVGWAPAVDLADGLRRAVAAIAGHTPGGRASDGERR